MSLPTAVVYTATSTLVFHIWKGQVVPQQLGGEKYSRLGQIGSGVQLVGAMAPPSPIRALYLTTTAADAVAMVNAVSLLPFTFVNITEPDGRAWTQALVLSVAPSKRNGIYPFNGTTYPLCVQVDFVFEAQQ